MKILHTSDWHLGHILYDYDRREDHETMFRQMNEIVAAEKPDAFVLAGDIFDASQPSAEAQTRFVQAMMELHEISPEMQIVAIAGNHDSPSRIEIFSRPWKGYNVTLLGQIDKDDPAQHIIELPGKGFVIAVPYCNDRNLPEGFYQTLLDMTAERNPDGLPVVMAAHCTVRGCDFAGHLQLRDGVVGNVEAQELEYFGTGFDYLALGHIHREQFVGGSGRRVRYCGTPVSISFDERHMNSVSMVEIDKHGDAPRVRLVEIEQARPLVNIPEDGCCLMSEAVDLLRRYPEDKQAFIRLNVKWESAVIGSSDNEEVRRIAADKGFLFCLLNAVREKKREGEEGAAITIDELREMKPLELARNFARAENKPFTDRMAELFDQAYEMVIEEERNK